MYQILDNVTFLLNSSQFELQISGKEKYVYIVDEKEFLLYEDQVSVITDEWHEH